jgi:XTP/dITP diphosphohydrolase
MALEILLATRNQKKKLELQELLDNPGIRILTLEDIDHIPEIIEDGCTFEENAVKKARETAALSGYTCLADDSGLVVDALEGKPGIYSARFAGPEASDHENNEKLLDLLKDIEVGNRTARFICFIAISTPGGEVESVYGTCEGRIALAPRGKGGFGYDPLFIPAGYEESFGELPASIKNAISHRAQALKKCQPILAKFLGL